MTKYHPLTEKLFKRLSIISSENTKLISDSIIREELGKMAKELTSKNWGHQTYPQFVRDILGLTDGGEAYRIQDDLCRAEPEKPKQEWCEHTAIDKAGRYYYKKYAPFSMPKEATHCQFCGTPRPKEKSLVEKVAEAIYQTYFNHPRSIDDNECHLSMAQAALAVMEKEMGK